MSVPDSATDIFTRYRAMKVSSDSASLYNHVNFFEEWDVIIVGAGPSGSSAAYDLAEMGYKVLILEKNELPRNKLCGGALSEVARSYLRFPIPEAYDDWQCYGARVHFGKRVVDAKLNERIATLVTRRTFDKYLVDMALKIGAHIKCDRVINIDVKDEKAIVKTTNGMRVSSKVVIVASGALSGLCRHVRHNDSLDETGFCLEQNYPIMKPDPYSDLDGLIDIYFGVGRFGYGWVFHHGSYYSIGVGGLRSLMDNPKEIMKKFWLDRGFPAKDFDPKGASIPCGGIRRELVNDRLILVGDAAGFVDPFYGEGIQYAIRSGQLGAETAANALKHNVFSKELLRNYELKCDHEFKKNLKYSLFLTRLSHNLPSVFIRLLASNVNVLRKNLLVPKGELSYFKYLQWFLPRSPWYFMKSIFNDLARKILHSSHNGIN